MAYIGYKVNVIDCDWLISSQFVTRCTLKDTHPNQRTRHHEISSTDAIIIDFFFLQMQLAHYRNAVALAKRRASPATDVEIRWSI